MGTRTIVLIAGFALACAQIGAAAAASATPFKLGTFEKDARQFVGVVVRDSVVIELSAANGGPRDMKELIAQYDRGLRQKIVELVAAQAQGGGSKVADPCAEGPEGPAADHVSGDDVEHSRQLR